MTFQTSAVNGLQVFIAGEYYLPLYFQAVEEASPIRSGVLILPFILSETVMGVMVGFLIHRTGRYLELMWIGTFLMTLGFGLFIHLNATSSLVEIVASQIVAGIGSGLLFEPPLIAIQAHVAQDDTATATATFGFTMNMAMSISIVVGGVIFQNSMQNSASTLSAAGLSADIVHKFAGDDAAANVMVISTIADAGQKNAIKGAYTSSLRNMWILYTCVSFLGIVASVFVQRRELSKEHVETRTGLIKKDDPISDPQT